MLFNEKVLELAVSQIGLNVGWQSMSQQSMRVLQTLVIKYIQELGKATMGYANNCNRHSAFLRDVILAMGQMSISLEEVQEYINEVDCVPFIKGNCIPLYPCPPPKGYVRINFPGPEEIASRPAYMEEWLPSLNFGDKSDEKDQANGHSDETNGPEGFTNGEAPGKKTNSNDPEGAAAHERMNNHIHLSSVYLDEDGRIVGRNGKEGVAPDSRLPPKDDYEERRIAEEEERRKSLEAEEAEKRKKQKEKEEIKPKIIRTKLKDKPIVKMRKSDLGSAKKRGGLGFKGAGRKKTSPFTLKVSLSGLHSGTPTAKPSPSVTPHSPLSFLNDDDDDDDDSLQINSKENSKTTIDEDTSAKYENTINDVIEEVRRENYAINPHWLSDEDASCYSFERRELQNSKPKKIKKKIIKKTKKKDSFDLTIDNVVKTSAEDDVQLHEDGPKKDNVYTFSEENNMDVKMKEESGVDAKEAAKILVSLSEDVPKKHKKSDLKKLKVSSPTPSSPPTFSGFKGSNTSFPKVAPGSTPMSPNANPTIFNNPFSSPLRSPPQPPIPTPPLFSSRSDFYQLGSSITPSFQSSTSNADSLPKPTLKTLAAKKALPPIDEAMLLKKEKKDKKLKEKEKAINKKKDKDKEREKKKEKEREIQKEKEREKEREREREKEREEKEREKEREREREREREKERERERKEKEKEREREREKEKLKAKPKNLDELKDTKKSKKLKKTILDEPWLDKKVDTKLSIKAFSRREDSPIREPPSPASSTSSNRLVIRTPPSPIDKKKKKQRTNSTPGDEPPSKKAKTVIKEKVKDKVKSKDEKKVKEKMKDDVSCVLITETIAREERGRQEEKEWLCPVCSIPYDGAGNMIGCDGCDDWYHWTCVGIKEDPGEEESWFCVRCIQKQKEIETKVIKKTNSTASSSSKSSRKDWSCPVCRDNNPKGESDPMIGCDKCDEWYHYSCVNLKKEPSEDETWYCPPCLPKFTSGRGAGSSSGGEGGRSSGGGGSSSKSKKSKQPKASRPTKSEKNDKKDSHKSSSSSSYTWSCRVCNKSNNSKPCIACDSCDQWFHWPCVGIVIPPGAEDSWFCEDCKKTR